MSTPLRPLERPLTPGRATWIAALILAAPAHAQDPFQAHLRWTIPSPPTEPAIPQSIAFSAYDNLVWTSWTGAHPAFSIATSLSTGLTTPLFATPAPPTSSGSSQVISGHTHEALFALAQFSDPDSLHRATQVSRYSAITAQSGTPFTPHWTYNPGIHVNGPAKIACDTLGRVLTLAIWNDSTQHIHVDRLDASTGALLSQTSIPGANLSELCLSPDGTRAAISCGLDLWVLDTASAPLHHETLPTSTTALALSLDGKRLAIGGHSTLRILDDTGSNYATSFTIAGSAPELSTRAALSHDGNTLAVAWWNGATGVSIRFEVWDLVTHTRLLNHAQTGAPGGLQNFPACVRVTRDGRRAALGCWGDGSSAPEILVFDRDHATIPLAVDLPGSVLALDLDDTGTRIAVGVKSTHANVYSATGETRLYDTGESELAVLRPAQAGGTLDLAARRAGAISVTFLDGDRSPTPISIQGVAGTLHLRRFALHAARKRADPSGRADHSFSIPSDPLLIGTYRHVQAAFRVNGALHLGTDVIDVLVL